MHIAGAMQTPVIALFGPTDEKKVGPLGESDQVIREASCKICDRSDCPNLCLEKIPVETVLKAIP